MKAFKSAAGLYSLAVRFGSDLVGNTAETGAKFTHISLATCLSHMLIAGCDIGVQLSVRPSRYVNN